eukprot:1181426-Ditylum_brightwellii.AAC.1
MDVLDGLDIGLKASKLGRRDGWEDGDVTGDDWDPTDLSAEKRRECIPQCSIHDVGLYNKV